MKEKIIARLKAKFSGVNLSKARMDAIADKLKITEETEIDEKLDDLNAIFPFAELARQDDRVRTIEAKEKKEKEDAAKDPSNPSSQEPATPPAGADFAKLIQDALNPLVQEIAGLKAGKTLDTRKSQLEARLEKAPDVYKTQVFKDFGRMKFDSDEEFNEYLAEKATDAETFTQSLSNQGMSQFQKPHQTSGGGSTKQATKEELEAVMANL